MTTTMTLSGCPVTDYKLAVSGQHVERPYCRWGQDYDCSCVYCSDGAYRAACKKVDTWNVATAEHRAWVVAVTSALACLANIGHAVRAALAPGLVVHSLVAWAVNAWGSSDGNIRGFYFRVVGKRGKAAAHVGKIGICKWVGESHGGGYYRQTTTTRLGLAIDGEEKLVYVAFGQCERMPEPIEVRQANIERDIVARAIAPVRSKWSGFVPAKKKSWNRAKWLAQCPVVYVVSGRHTGKSGPVFWTGADKQTNEAGARLGLECNGETLWVSAYDCADRPLVAVSAEERALIERVAADAALSGDDDKARKVLAMTWVES